MNFGAINPEGGERRLNVAVTRARQEFVVFSGITADKIDAERTKSQGVRDLKTFLDYAERGPVALPARVEGSEGEADSPFEEAVAEELRKRGWNVVPQVGISGFRVDIGVKHPDKAGAYLAGVECDGASYHSSATARDRDKIREEILRGLGWNILRVWSTDWWFDQEASADKLHQALQSLHASVSVQVEPSPEPVEHAEQPASETPAKSQDQGQPRVPGGPTRSLGELYQSPGLPWDLAPDGRSDQKRAETLQTPDRIAGAAPSAEVAPTGSIPQNARSADDPPSAASGRQRYEITDLSDFSVDPDAFFDFSYRDTLGAMVAAVLENEAPVREDLLAQRIARAHGWQRTGRRIRERIELHLRDIDRTHESTGVFLWPKGSVVERTPYRPSAGPEHHRAISEISTAELRDVVADNPSLAKEEDPALVFARMLNVDRLSASARARLEEVLEM
jgi:very-short-patch-repair endonuclease